MAADPDLAQIRTMSRRADRVERDEAAPRLTREHSLVALTTRVRRVGQHDDQ